MSLILAMCAFALAMSISPGPVNIITLSSGANHGIARTLPFVSGATVGFTSLLAILGFGAAQAIEHYPRVMDLLGLCGTLFIFYMAYKIATAKGNLALEKRLSPSFLDGALLQWLNPKAWVACLSGVAAFTTQGEYSGLILFCVLYFFICYFGIAFWAVIGTQAKRLIHDERQMRQFNAVMGGGLALVGVYLLIS